MIWLAWREQRTEAILAAGALFLLVALLVPTGLHMASAYADGGLSACLVQHPSAACSDAVQAFSARFRQVGNLMGWLTLLPGLVGALLAAPFVLSLENGSYRLDWTQSVTRARWIAVKLGFAVGAGLVTSIAYVALVTWWRTPLVNLEGRMEPSVFDSEGIVVLGYTLFAIGVALAVGVVWRRAIPALVVAFVAYFVARLFVDTWLRQRLTPPATATWHAGDGEPARMFHAWVITGYPSDELGHHALVPFGACLRSPQLGSCLAKHGAGYMHAVFEPASRFWQMQTIEFGLFAGVGVALVAFAASWVHARA